MSSLLSEHALSLLLTETIEGKLTPLPASLGDEPRGSVREQALLITEPGRPVGLRFCRDRSRRHVFPRRKLLETDLGRAQALHFFANHELLAIEVVARALLVYPDAPPSWHQALQSTLVEEQRHLRLYINRMRELGLDFGELPVNDYIWKRALEVPDTRGFIAFFALTLEGANLDHAAQYAELFTELGDERSAAVMQQVFADEIVHVRRGVQSFEEMRDADLSLFSSFESALVWPMTPGRARGPRFHRQSRKAAGFPESFIQALLRCPRKTTDSTPKQRTKTQDRNQDTN